MLLNKLLRYALLAVVLVMTSACSNWTTRYSGVYRESNSVVINLNEDGPYTVGFCGICRSVEATYIIKLVPIKRQYRDDEIDLKRVDTREKPIAHGPMPEVNFTRLKALGTLAFDADYSHFDMNIRIEKDGRLVRFPGNGRYQLRSGD